MSLISDYLTRRAEQRAERRAQDARDRLCTELRTDLDWTWRQVCEHHGLCHRVDTPTGATAVIPRLLAVDPTPDGVVLVVQLLPGQVPDDFTAAADRIAAAFGVPLVRVTPRGTHWIRLALLHRDPLDGEVTIERPDIAPASVTERLILIARSEAGDPIQLTWTQAPHVCVQGATRSGKSVWCYSVLGQLVRLDDVLIAGSDPSGLLLGRPYEGTRHHEWQATGSGDVLAHLHLLRRLVAEMDDRIADLPPRADKWETFTPDRPLVVVVLEEFAGLLRLASTLPAPRGEAKLRDQLLGLYGRLVSEGHKAGFRLLVITQRADATIVGGFERGQLAMKLSFRVDDDEALPMLHGSAGRPLVGEHRYAPPGVALLDSPTHRLSRVRGPRLPGPDEQADYARYWDEIRTVAACRDDQAA
jgi:S-DNA-T family DNA segregation ATPase FtsK/SpoIIIE